MLMNLLHLLTVSCYLHPRVLLPLSDPSPEPFEAVVPPGLTADAGGGPILPHPGFITLAAAPPNVILLDPPMDVFLTGESLALLAPKTVPPFSFPPSLPLKNTLFARPGDAVVPPRRLVPRGIFNCGTSKSREGPERRPCIATSFNGEF